MPPDDADARESAARIEEMLRLLTSTRPLVVEAVERCVSALVADEVRQRIIARLHRCTPEDLATVEALTAHLEDRRPRSDESA
jgi:hypothetical protein